MIYALVPVILLFCLETARKVESGRCVGGAVLSEVWLVLFGIQTQQISKS